MRIVFGVDAAGNWKSGADLLARLRFREGVVDTVHCVEPPVYHLGEPLAKLTSQIRAERTAKAQTLGQGIGDAVAALLRQDGVITGAGEVTSGPAADSLMRYADRVGADLIVVGSSGKTPVGAFLTGSVGRGLLIGAHQSVLIARGDAAATVRRPLRAVFATDHSAYATACLETLLRLAPQNIAELTVLTVYPKDTVEALRPFLPDFALDPAEWIEQGLEKRNRTVIDVLQPLGCRFASRIETGEVHESLHNVMAETRADLLILGAQGHGFVERLTLGSVSFREAITEGHSVLVLRAKPGSDDEREGGG